MASVDRDRLAEALDELYAAVGDDGRWPAVSAAVRQLVGADLAFLQHRPSLTQMEVLATNIPIAKIEAAGHWAQEDPFFAAALARPPRRGYLAEELVPWPLLRRTAFYRECMSGLLEARDFMGSLCTAPLGAIGLFRAADAVPFVPAERDLLGALTTHFERALALRSELRAARTGMALGLDALDALPIAAIVLRGVDTVMFTNRAAMRLIDQRDGLRLVGGPIRQQLEATSPDGRRMLSALLARQARAGPLAQPVMVAISRAQSAHKLVLSLAPLPVQGRAHLTVGEAYTLLLIRDPASTPVPTTESLRNLYGFTAAEVKVAIAVAEGASLAEIADNLRVSQFTIRSHLRRILDKTGARRQAEVVRILLTLPAFASSEAGKSRTDHGFPPGTPWSVPHQS